MKTTMTKAVLTKMIWAKTMLKKTIHKKNTCVTLALACAVLLCSSPAVALSTWDTPDAAAKEQPAPKRVHPDVRPEDTAATTKHWNTARGYQREQRFELARQHYLLALATCRTEETRDRLQRELQIVDLQLRSMR